MSATSAAMSLGGAGSKRMAGAPPEGAAARPFKRVRFADYDPKYDAKYLGPATSTEIFKELRERHLTFKTDIEGDGAPIRGYMPHHIIYIVLDYAQDPTLPENDDRMNARFVKRWRSERPLDRITVTVPTTLPAHEQLRRIFNGALDLIRHADTQEILFAHFADGGPLRRLTSVIKVAEKQGVLSAWDRSLFYLFSKICFVIPEAKAFVKETAGFRTLEEAEKAQRIRKWMVDNPEPLKKVVELVLNPKKYALLPPEIGMFPNLTTLKMASAPTCQLPFSFEQLQSLQNFYFSGDHVTELDERITALRALRVLEMPLSRLKHLPDSFGALTNLEIANFNHNNELASLPDTVVRCTKLVQLELRNSQITRLPENIGALKELQVLDLEGAIDLEELPLSALQLTKLGSKGEQLAKLLEDAQRRLQIDKAKQEVKKAVKAQKEATQRANQKVKAYLALIKQNKS